MQTMPARFAAAGLGNATGMPSRVMWPSSGCTTPAMIFMSVDLPAPFSPSTAWIEPRLQAKSTLRKA